MGSPPDLSLYPDQPGIYLYKDAKGKILYVGKARSIRKRLASYFNTAPRHVRTEAMLAEFDTIDTVVAKTESEALALENAFIKKHKPRYNILLRDDKTYPYIKVTTGEDWPRAFVTRRVLKDGHSYFGPFLPARTCRGAMKMVQRMFQIRTCRIEIDGTLPRPCLYYDMHACLGPCVAGLTTKSAYDDAVKDVLLFLSGRNEELEPRLEVKMRAAAESENFEMAAAYRDCLRTVEELAEKQRVQSVSGEDVDIFGDFFDGGNIAVALLFVRGGVVLDSREYFWEGIGDVPPEEFWVSLLSQYYDTMADGARSCGRDDVPPARDPPARRPARRRPRADRDVADRADGVARHDQDAAPRRGLRARPDRPRQRAPESSPSLPARARARGEGDARPREGARPGPSSVPDRMLRHFSPAGERDVRVLRRLRGR